MGQFNWRQFSCGRAGWRLSLTLVCTAAVSAPLFSAPLFSAPLLAQTGTRPAPTQLQAPSALPAGFTTPSGYGDSVYPALGDAGLDVTHYDLSLRSDPGVDRLIGRAVLNIEARTPLTQISLDFAGPQVLGVKLNGRSARHVQAGEKLLILPPAPIAAGTAFTLTVAYSGTPALHLDASSGGGLRLGWIAQAGGSYVLSEPDGAHTFFPCNDVPADGASYSLHLNLPAGTTAVASGVQTRQTTLAGRTLSDFELVQEIPTYALTVHTGRLELVTQPGPAGIQIRNAFPVGLPDTVRAAFGQTPAMLGFLADWFGPYPYPVYGVAVTEDPQLPALETATLSTFPSRPEAPVTALHELAHQWFGDNLRLGDWSDIWLNEGFATYAELLWAEGQGEAAAPILDRWYARLVREPARGVIASTPAQLFDSSSYFRGALTLHALRLKVGDARFRQILRTYAARFSARSVRTTDFLGVVQELGGAAALEAMQPWLTGTALPPLPKETLTQTVR
ncbi:M1 family metallopeptidase [Deinococcus altitudinis]|uniref:M1 family metallopeptidase n=1 Tax=Deinococcus altitudinis TaxID=468914 RepID=UPI003892C9C5